MRGPALDWRLHRSHTRNTIVCGARFRTKVLAGMAIAIRAVTADLATRLIPMGVWCDFERNRMHRENGCDSDVE